MQLGFLQIAYFGLGVAGGVADLGLLETRIRVTGGKLNQFVVVSNLNKKSAAFLSAVLPLAR